MLTEQSHTVDVAIKKDLQRRRRNARRRAENEALRELTGTSAAAARLDMGLAKR
jgi:hypothetical protein